MYNLSAPHEQQHENSYTLHDTEEETFTVNKWQTNYQCEVSHSH